VDKCTVYSKSKRRKVIEEDTDFLIVIIFLGHREFICNCVRLIAYFDPYVLVF